MTRRWTMTNLTDENIDDITNNVMAILYEIPLLDEYNNDAPEDDINNIRHERVYDSIHDMLREINLNYMENSICPACRLPVMRPVETHNALSRYTDAYICSNCGTREALEGDFWKNLRND